MLEDYLRMLFVIPCEARNLSSSPGPLSFVVLRLRVTALRWFLRTVRI